MLQEQKTEKTKRKNGQLIIISLLSLVIVALFLIEIYEIINDPTNLTAMGVIAAVTLAAVFVETLLIGKMSINKSKDQEDALDNVYRSEKANYLLMRKNFEHFDKKIESLSKQSEIPARELMSAQKALAKVQINRTKENADALLISNDKMVEKINRKLDNISYSGFSEQDKAVLAENNKNILDKQQEVLDGLKELENSLRSDILESANKLASMKPQQVMSQESQILQQDQNDLQPIGLEEDSLDLGNINMDTFNQESETELNPENTELGSLEIESENLKSLDFFNSESQDLGSINTESLDLDSVNTESLDLESINTGLPDLESVNTGLSDLESVNTGLSDLESINTGLSDLESINTGSLDDLESINAGLLDLGSINTGSLDLESINTGSSDLESINTGSSDLDLVNAGSMDLDSVSPESFELGSLEMEDMEVEVPEIESSAQKNMHAVQNSSESALDQLLMNMDSNVPVRKKAEKPAVPLTMDPELGPIADEPEITSFAMDTELGSIMDEPVAPLAIEEPESGTNMNESEIASLTAGFESGSNRNLSATVTEPEAVPMMDESLSLEQESAAAGTGSGYIMEEIQSDLLAEEPKLEAMTQQMEMEYPASEMEPTVTETMQVPVEPDRNQTVKPAPIAAQHAVSLSDTLSSDFEQPSSSELSQSDFQSMTKKMESKSMANDSKISGYSNTTPVLDLSSNHIMTPDEISAMIGNTGNSSLKKKENISYQSDSNVSGSMEQIKQSETDDTDIDQILKEMDIDNFLNDSVEDLDIDQILKEPDTESKSMNNGKTETNQVMNSDEIAALIASTDMLDEPSAVSSMPDLSNPSQIMNSDEIAALIASM